MVPAFNILAVIGLSIFNNDGEKPNLKKVLKGIAKNPLILGIMAGLLALGIRSILVSADISFRISNIPAIYNTLKYLSNIATPLALLVLGAQFEFSAIPALKREIISGIILRSLIVPLLGIGVAYLVFRQSFTGAQFAALVAVFCTPVAVSSEPDLFSGRSPGYLRLQADLECSLPQLDEAHRRFHRGGLQGGFLQSCPGGWSEGSR